MNDSKYFDCTYVINIKERIDRKNSIIKELHKVNIKKYIIFDAIIPTDEDIMNWNKSLYYQYCENLDSIRGMLGCIFSHVAVYKKSIENEYNRIMVLEDDCVFVKNNVCNLLEKYIGNTYFDAIWLGGTHKRKGIKINDNLYRTFRTYTTHAMIVNKKFMNHVIDNINGTTFAFDVYLYKNIQSKFLCECLAIVPCLAIQNIGFSDILLKTCYNNTISDTDSVLIGEHSPIATCDMIGGLGNQLFQIANVISFAKSNNINFEFRYTETADGKPVSPTYWYTMLPKLQEYLVNVQNTNSENTLILTESYLSENLNINNVCKKYIFFQGFFQSHEYFHKNRDNILDLFVNNEMLSKLRKKYCDLFTDNVINVAIHVRRTDYIKYKYIYGVLDIEYYLQAMEIIKNMNKDKQINFLIFSDDTKWCKQNFATGKIICGNKDYEDLMLMSLCDHFIIPNSTFGWWGSYLGTHEKKTIVAPKYWRIDENTNINKIYLPETITI